jgi:GGDEF domain-containing protein
MPRILRRLIEIAGAIAIVVLLDLFTPATGGFADIYGLPYLLIPPLFAAFYSLNIGLISLLIMTAVLAVPVALFLPSIAYADALSRLLEAYRISYPLSIFFAFIFGGILQVEKKRNEQLRARMRSLAKSNWSMKKKSNALFASNVVLENRVSSQTSSMSLLHNQMNKFSNVSVQDTLDVLLETVNMFIGAEEASVWEFVPSVQQLRLISNFGWRADVQRESVLSVNDSIEGWVVRNSSYFSYRMILENEMLEKLDRGRSIITVPILIGNRPWGVLNIEALPFPNYSEYSEKVLQIIIKLAQPFLQQSVEYERMFKKQEADEVTGLPLYSQFRAVLDREVQGCSVSGGNLSLIIIELVNVQRLLQDFDISDIKSLINRLIDYLKNGGEAERYYFHYRETTQLAIISPNTDMDGTSMLSLDILSYLNSANWEIHGKPVPLEVVIGHSSLHGSGSSEDLLNQAEGLLEMQRI